MLAQIVIIIFPLISTFRCNRIKSGLILNPLVEEMNYRNLTLATVGKGAKTKSAKRKLGRLGGSQGVDWPY